MKRVYYVVQMAQRSKSTEEHHWFDTSLVAETEEIGLEFLQARKALGNTNWLYRLVRRTETDEEVAN